MQRLNAMMYSDTSPHISIFFPTHNKARKKIVQIAICKSDGVRWFSEIFKFAIFVNLPFSMFVFTHNKARGKIVQIAICKSDGVRWYSELLKMVSWTILTGLNLIGGELFP